MLNKPINPSPYFENVDANEGFAIKCEIPRANLSGYNLSICDADTDKIVTTITRELKSTTDSIEKEFVNSENGLVNGKDYYWNATYYSGSPPNADSSYPDSIIKEYALTKTTVVETVNKGSSYINLTNIKASDEPKFSTGEAWDGKVDGCEAKHFAYWTDGSLLYRFGEFEKEIIPLLKENQNKYIVEIGGYYYTIKEVGIVHFDIYSGMRLGSDIQRNGACYIKYNSPVKTTTTNGSSIHGSNTLLNIYEVVDGLVIREGGFIKTPDNSWKLVTSVETSMSVETSTSEDNKMTPFYKVAIDGIFENGFSSGSDVYYTDSIDYNTSPNYYFRARKTPKFSVVCDDIVDGVLKAPEASFGISYEQDDGVELDYFYFSMSSSCKFNTSQFGKKYYSLTDTFEYKGFTSGTKEYANRYKIYAIAVDVDGNCITSSPLEFKVEYNITEIEKKLSLDQYFVDTRGGLETEGDAIVLRFSAIYSQYIKDQKLSSTSTTDSSCIDVNIYRVTVSDNSSEIIRNDIFEHVGTWQCDEILENIYDYCAANRKKYYYVLSFYLNSDLLAILKTNTIVTDFCGAYIAPLSIEGDKYEVKISDCFNLSLKFDNQLSPKTVNLSREYIEGFGRYYKGLRGNLEAISSSEVYLLGSQSDNGDYAEGFELEQKWKDLVRNYNQLLYRPFIGEPMIIDIKSYSLQPYYYNSERETEVHFDYMQIGSCEDVLITRN